MESIHNKFKERETTQKKEFENFLHSSKDDQYLNDNRVIRMKMF